MRLLSVEMYISSDKTNNSLLFQRSVQDCRRGVDPLRQHEDQRLQGGDNPQPEEVRGLLRHHDPELEGAGARESPVQPGQDVSHEHRDRPATPDGQRPAGGLHTGEETQICTLWRLLLVSVI